MADELSLFGNDSPPQPLEPARIEPQGQIADWLVTSLRQALDARGITDADERQRAIESAAGRPWLIYVS